MTHWSGAVDYPVKTLGQLRPILQGFRKAAGLTQAMMASRLGVTQQTYAQLEANPAAISVERLFRVLRVLGADLTLTDTGTRPPKAVDGDRIAAPSPALTADTAPPRAAKIASVVKAGRAARAVPSPPAKDTSSRGKGAAKTAGATPPRSGRADKDPLASRPGSKKAAAARKRENW
ncbi:FIG00458905: hypothetical protein [Caballeronia glathei]|uniref:helix-turn-helix transcriptional regulator n=1 Tax=Caballeronia glathei TaxID=60547 RepID=UPI000501FAE4|nr:helix-turn-helix transcriptional regulator [Caballeronia glathei]CDY78490.1 FIG00458905: hypothetical protein [Caballeronia glathei]